MRISHLSWSREHNQGGSVDAAFKLLKKANLSLMSILYILAV